MWLFSTLLAALLVGGHCQTLLEVDVGESKSIRYTLEDDEIQNCYVTLPSGGTYELSPNATDLESDNERFSSIATDDDLTLCGLIIDLTTFEDSGTYSLTIVGKSTNASATYDLRVQKRTPIWPSSPLQLYASKTAYIVLPRVEGTIQSCYVTPPGQEELEVTSGSTVSTSLKQWSLSSDSWCGVEIAEIDADSGSGYWKLTVAINSTHFYYNEVIVKVKDSSKLEETTATAEVYVGESYNGTFGHEDASYCQLTNPQGETQSLRAGMCLLNLTTVTTQFAGTWIAWSGLKGSPEEVKEEINVQVTETPYISAYSSESTVISGAINLFCKVSGVDCEICRFISPNGTGISMTLGVGNDGYAPYYNESGDYTCGLTILSPTTDDYGTWECQTGHTSDIRTGYITVSASETRDASTSVEISESYTAYAIQQGNLTLSCTAKASLNYCWFLHPNGSYYSAVPDATVDNGLWTYSGDGLSLGSCSITFREASSADSGVWTCNMGVVGETTDQSVTITVKVTSSYMAATSVEENNSTVTAMCAIKNDLKALTYCRFIRPDGTGINAAYADSGSKYSLTGNLGQGECGLVIDYIEDVDNGTWTCAGKLQTDTSEVSDTFTVAIRSGASTISLSILLLITVTVQVLGLN